MHANLLREVRGLQADADAVFQPLPLVVRIETEDRNLAFRTRAQPFGNFCRGGLPGTVWGQAARRHLPVVFEIDALHGLNFAVGLLQSMNRDGWRSGIYGDG